MKLPTGKLMLALAASLALVGCASIGPPEPPSLELPKPATDLRATRKGSTLTLTWTIPARTTDHQNVRYLGKTRICRTLAATLASCGTPVNEVAPPANFATTKNSTANKQTATYVGEIWSGLHLDPKQSGPFASATYAVEVLNLDNRSAGLSNQVRVSLAETLPPPTDLASHLTAQGVVLTWTGQMLSLTEPQPVRYSYRVFRRQEGSQQQVLVGEVGAGVVRDLSLTDQNMEWEKTYYYHADTLTVIAEPGEPAFSIDGDDTPEVKIFADDVFPPAVPSGLQAVFSGPGQQAFIDLVWSPVTDADLAGYNIYRHEEGAAPIKLNSALVGTPAFRDTNVAPGKTYFYSVSAVDQRGNESARSQEASESVP
jgi:hypothetical protein